MLCLTRVFHFSFYFGLSERLEVIILVALLSSGMNFRGIQNSVVFCIHFH